MESNGNEPRAKIVASRLSRIANLNNAVAAFRANFAEFRLIYATLEELHTVAADYDCLSFELERERRYHVEELRHINQDINYLDGLLKGTRQCQDFQKQKLHRELHYLESKLDGLSVEEAKELTLEPIWPSSSKKIAVRNSERGAVVPQTTFDASQKDKNVHAFSVINVTSPDPGRTAVIANFNKLINLATFKPPNSGSDTLTTSGFRSTNYSTLYSNVPGNKLKICQACYQHIHRNAPICPFCKVRIRSKSNQRNKK